MPKLHEAWGGRNRFYCGCCITGPIGDCPANLCWYICAIGVTIPLSIFVTGKLWVSVTPALPIAFYLSILITTFFLLLTSCTDPGFLPRRSLIKNNHSFDFLLCQMPQGPKRNFCSTCLIFRPPRASHCSNCDNCVQVFDHHCGFVNNCIGKRNYRFFIMFLVGIMCSIGTLVMNFIVYGISAAGTNIDPTIIIIVGSVLAGLVGIPLLGFLIFHICLSCKGKTTREILKHIPQNQQLQQNNQWCDVDPSRLDFFAEITTQELQRIHQQNKDLQFVPPSASM